ncbi:hypothetical protein KP509_11G072300 [Ceratopteris richardii]|uniref:Uncharacterized protein n=1 Tax=Ceratopteris richardii TaxID=49495 RepID=A0A8T2TWS2_CERRI|nr:hypothetical protein KP509_11G072300 [Ceratopteris richardii]
MFFHTKLDFREASPSCERFEKSCLVLSSGFPHICFATMHKTCTSICGSVRPYRIGFLENDIENIRSSFISSLDIESSHLMSPETSFPLQKYLIVCILQICFSNGYPLFNVDNHRILDLTYARPPETYGDNEIPLLIFFHSTYAYVRMKRIVVC